jgi:hypothetical protein
VAFLQISRFLPAWGVVACSIEHGQDWWYFLCEFVAGRSQDHAARVRCGFQECGADGLFEVVDLTSEGGPSDAEVFGGLVDVGCPGPVRAYGTLPCEGEVEIRRVPEPAEYATLSPEHDDDSLRAQIARTDECPARRRSIRRRPTHGRLAPCGN